MSQKAHVRPGSSNGVTRAGSSRQSRTTLLAQVHSRPWLILLLTVVLLAPFLGKAITIDDPLFVWVARHLQQHPLDPYGFKSNWFGPVMPMTTNVQNPPLTSYWLAVAGLAGWGETWLHLMMLPWAVLLIWGVIRLARSIGADPFWAALLTLGSSAFLVAATNLMCDVMMVALMVWAVQLWVDGLQRNRFLRLWSAGVLAGLAAMTKYFALGVLPMLLLYTLAWLHRQWLDARGTAQVRWAAILAPRRRELIGVAAGTLTALFMILAWHFWSRHLYGTSHIAIASEFAGYINKRFSYNWFRIYPTFTFLGGCLMWPLILGCRRVRGLVVTALGAAAGVLLLPLAERSGSGQISPSMYVLGAVCFAGGIALLWLIAERAIKGWRNPDTLILLMWIGGTLLFAAVLNWTVAARNILPLVPAAALLASLPQKAEAPATAPKRSRAGTRQGAVPLQSWFGAAAAFALAAALVMTWTDWRWANSVRDAAGEIVARYKTPANRLIYQGHWGFQYYMDLAGAEAMNFCGQDIFPGDVVVYSSNSSDTNVKALLNALPVIDRISRMPTGGLYLNSLPARAGFYSHMIGRLPLAYEKVPDTYTVLAYRSQPVQPPRQ